MFNKSMLPLVFVFLALGATILLLRNNLEEKGVDWQVLTGGNLVVYIITIISMQLITKGLNAKSTHAFLRNAYSGILVKLLACAAAAFIYILVAGKNLNKPALFICKGFYLVYSAVEMSLIMKLSKQNKNVGN